MIGDDLGQLLWFIGFYVCSDYCIGGGWVIVVFIYLVGYLGIGYGQCEYVIDLIGIGVIEQYYCIVCWWQCVDLDVVGIGDEVQVVVVDGYVDVVGQDVYLFGFYWLCGFGQYYWQCGDVGYLFDQVVVVVVVQVYVYQYWCSQCGWQVSQQLVQCVWIVDVCQYEDCVGGGIVWVYVGFQCYQ